MDFRKPTMKDVAETAGVSISTVSHVLNGTRFVSAEATGKVKKAVRDLKFKANSLARNLRSGKSLLIGYVVSNMENYFYVNIARGIEKVINPLGYQLILIDSAEQKKAEMRNIESLYLRGIDGIILAPTKPGCSYLTNLLPPDFPLVFVDRRGANYPGSCVLLNNKEAACEAVQYFLGKGLTKIAFISFHFGETGVDETIGERINGYKQAYQEAGLEADPRLIRTPPGDPAAVSELHRVESYYIMEELLETGVEAVLCGNSLTAIGVFDCLRDRGVKIPREVGLITFDDDLWLSMTSPRITAVSQPAESMGAAAARLLIKQIRREYIAPGSLRLKAEILYRESC
ncbi:MAG: LacI family transcriptional regulator [Treponema sp.]|jgi:LacI family transcriptional regulator|nr:LacI family transcriptional regulator [Treponema sp.]